MSDAIKIYDPEAARNEWPPKHKKTDHIPTCFACGEDSTDEGCLCENCMCDMFREKNEI